MQIVPSFILSVYKHSLQQHRLSLENVTVFVYLDQSEMKISPILAVAAVAVVFAASFSTSEASEQSKPGEMEEVQFREYDLSDPIYDRGELPGELLAQRRSCVRVRCRIYPRPVYCWCIQWA